MGGGGAPCSPLESPRIAPWNSAARLQVDLGNNRPSGALAREPLAALGSELASGAKFEPARKTIDRLAASSRRPAVITGAADT